MNKISLINRIAAITGLAIGGFALSVLAATTWTAPAGPAPSNNVDAPINVGASTQKKTGALGIGNGTMPGGSTIFDVFGTAVINALQTASVNIQGTPGSLTVSGPTTLSGSVKITSGASANVGKYLQMADASGNVTWGDPAAGGSSGGTTSGTAKLLVGKAQCFGGGCALGDIKYNACSLGPETAKIDGVEMPVTWVLVGWTIHSGGAPSAGMCVPIAISNE